MIVTGKYLKEDGMARALEPEESWLARYNRIIQDWFDSRPDGFRFTGETLRMIARDRGLDEPHTHKCWGGAASRILSGWRREGKIGNTGRTVSARSPKTRAHQMPQYEKIISRRYRQSEPENQLELLA